MTYSHHTYINMETLNFSELDTEEAIRDLYINSEYSEYINHTHTQRIYTVNAIKTFYFKAEIGYKDNAIITYIVGVFLGDKLKLNLSFNMEGAVVPVPY